VHAEDTLLLFYLRGVLQAITYSSSVVYTGPAERRVWYSHLSVFAHCSENPPPPIPVPDVVKEVLLDALDWLSSNGTLVK